MESELRNEISAMRETVKEYAESLKNVTTQRDNFIKMSDELFKENESLRTTIKDLTFERDKLFSELYKLNLPC